MSKESVQGHSYAEQDCTDLMSACSLDDGSSNYSSTRLNPIARALLEGLYDQGSELYKLQGMWHLLENIWGQVTAHWESHIEHCESEPPDMYYVPPNCIPKYGLDYADHTEIDVGYLDVGAIKFPTASDVCINMMPFILDTKDFEKCMLPDNLEPYWKELIQHCHIQPEEMGEVGYLTIHESYVDPNNCQRRPGIHTESPGILYIHKNGGEGKDIISSDSGNGTAGNIFMGWGMGQRYTNVCDGGIYMASNVQDSCRIWGCKILEATAEENVIGNMGDIEHLRYYLTNSVCMEENRLYWFTDRTPHESLPLTARTYRQFFRLVTSQVSVWFEDHSTKNPLGIVPDPNITRIVRGSKFDKEGVVLVRDIDV